MTNSIDSRIPINKASTYRYDIDGLRAIAVIAVIFNHTSKSFLPGGFLGVDIFFVISGFVITSSFANRQYSNFSSLLADFYSRRIKRLFPALFLCLFLSAISLVLVDPAPGNSLSTASYAIFGLSNIQLFLNSTDYFAQSTDLNPFVHTWSLSLEEQFYLFFPFIIWLSGFSRNKKHGSKNLFFVLLFVFLTSFTLFVSIYSDYPSAAYFLIPTRLWEIAIGSLSFLAPRLFYIPKIKSRYLAHCLLVALFFLFLIPYQYSLWTISITPFVTIFLIYATPYSVIVNSFLSWRPMLFVGSLSYSLYLWHWPILSLSRWTIGINLYTIPFLYLAIFLLSLLSYNSIETFFRFRFNFSSLSDVRSTIIIISGISSASFLYFFNSFLYKHSLLLFLGKASIVRPGFVAPASTNAFKSRLKICTHQSSSSVFSFDRICLNEVSIGDSVKSNNYLVGLVGDSMASSLAQLLYNEESYSDISTFFATRNSCLFPQSSTSIGNCASWSSSLRHQILSLASQYDQSLFIIHGYYQYYFHSNLMLTTPFRKSKTTVDNYILELNSLAHDLSPHNSSILVTLPSPVHSINPYPHCFKEWFRLYTYSTCTYGTSIELASINPSNLRQDLIDLAESTPNIFILDPVEALCNIQYCPIRDSSDNFLYIDSHHLSHFASNSIYPYYRDIRISIFD